MFLRIVEFIAAWVGPVLVLLGVGAWFSGAVPHAFPASALMPAGGMVFSGLSWFAAREERQRTMMIVLGASFVVGALFIAWTYLATNVLV